MRLELYKKEFNEIFRDRALMFSIVVQFLLVSMLLFIYASYSDISKRPVPVVVSIDSNDTELVSRLEQTGAKVIVRGGAGIPIAPGGPQHAVASISTENKTVTTDPSNIMSGFAIAKIRAASDALSFDEALSESNFTYFSEMKYSDPAEFVQMGYGVLVPIALILPAVVAMSFSTQGIFTERKKRTIELLLVSPVSDAKITLSKILPLVLISTVCAAAWLSMINRQMPIRNLPLLVAIAFLLTFALVALSVVLSCKARTVREANAFSSIIGMALMVSLILPYSEVTMYTPLVLVSRTAANAIDEKIISAFLVLAAAAFLSLLIALRSVSQLRKNYE